MSGYPDNRRRNKMSKGKWNPRINHLRLTKEVLLKTDGKSAFAKQYNFDLKLIINWTRGVSSPSISDHLRLIEILDLGILDLYVPPDLNKCKLDLENEEALEQEKDRHFERIRQRNDPNIKWLFKYTRYKIDSELLEALEKKMRPRDVEDMIVRWTRQWKKKYPKTKVTDELINGWRTKINANLNKARAEING